MVAPSSQPSSILVFVRVSMMSMGDRLLILRRQFLRAGMGVWATLSAGCGTILYPERRGQPVGRLDWGVVLLDGLGLLLFFIPGVVAFAVDFATGAIYLPPWQSARKWPWKVDRPLVMQRIPRDEITRQRIEAVVSSHIGRPIDLAQGDYRAQPLGKIDDFWREVDRLTSV
jgi:hypothetical protein